MIAILPLRKNSKRLKNKNIKKINGKPLFEFILKNLKNSKLVSKIVVTTDYKLKINHPKINILKRPKKLCGNCNMNMVIDHVINNFEDKNYIQVHATSPLVKSGTIDKAIKFFLQNKNYDSLFSVTKIKKRFWNSKNKPYNHKLSTAPTTQILKELFEENSGFYIFNKNVFKKKLNRIGYKPKLFEISKLEGFDIDDNQDFQIVKKLLS